MTLLVVALFCPYYTPTRLDPWDIWYTIGVRTASAVILNVCFTRRPCEDLLRNQYHSGSAASALCSFSLLFVFLFLMRFSAHGFQLIKILKHIRRLFCTYSVTYQYLNNRPLCFNLLGVRLNTFQLNRVELVMNSVLGRYR